MWIEWSCWHGKGYAKTYSTTSLDTNSSHQIISTKSLLRLALYKVCADAHIYGHGSWSIVMRRHAALLVLLLLGSIPSMIATRNAFKVSWRRRWNAWSCPCGSVIGIRVYKLRVRNVVFGGWLFLYDMYYLCTWKKMRAHMTRRHNLMFIIPPHSLSDPRIRSYHVFIWILILHMLIKDTPPSGIKDYTRIQNIDHIH